MTFRRLAIVVSLGLTRLPCPAQEAETVSIQFLAFPRVADPKPVELVVGEGKVIEVNAPHNELTPPRQVRQMDAWTFGETITDADRKPAFQVFAQAKALASPRQLILLIRKGETNAEGFDVIVIDGRTDRFGGGRFLFMNTSRLDLVGTVGKEEFVLYPRQHVIVKPLTDPGKRSSQVPVSFRTGEAAKPFFSSKWPNTQDSRGLIFFYHDPHTDRLRFHTIRDFL